jgi:hypothetical protein
MRGFMSADEDHSQTGNDVAVQTDWTIRRMLCTKNQLEKAIGEQNENISHSRRGAGGLWSRHVYGNGRDHSPGCSQMHDRRRERPPHTVRRDVKSTTYKSAKCFVDEGNGRRTPCDAMLKQKKT